MGWLERYEEKTVSIHAPARGATMKKLSSSELELVSIHAPARGATTAFCLIVNMETFLSTRPRGARQRRLTMICLRMVFLSTRPRGARLVQFRLLRYLDSFYPRAREGRDIQPHNSQHNRHVSIHAPARGATVKSSKMAASEPFLSTRPRGARRYLIGVYCVCVCVSIHAPARGATHSALIFASMAS